MNCVRDVWCWGGDGGESVSVRVSACEVCHALVDVRSVTVVAVLQLRHPSSNGGVILLTAMTVTMTTQVLELLVSVSDLDVSKSQRSAYGDQSKWQEAARRVTSSFGRGVVHLSELQVGSLSSVVGRRSSVACLCVVCRLSSAILRGLCAWEVACNCCL